MIYCVGDSHINIFSGESGGRVFLEPYILRGKLKNFRSFWIPSATAYNLKNENSTSKSFKYLNDFLNIIPNKSKILFCFGEIDCRMHIVKRAYADKKSLATIANEIVNKYIFVLRQMQDALNYKVIVFGIHPTRIGNDIDDIINFKFPFFGSNEEINRSIFWFNKLLEEKCKEYNIYFLTVNNILHDGYLNTQYYRDGIHLNEYIIPHVENILKRDNIL